MYEEFNKQQEESLSTDGDGKFFNLKQTRCRNTLRGGLKL